MIRTFPKRIRIGHSPDPDDAFMFYGITSGKVKPPFEIAHVIENIQSLNKRALMGELEVTAISAFAYGKVSDRYSVLRTGSSFGMGYGPIVVGRTSMSLEELRNAKVAVPGDMTSAYALLRLALGECHPVEVSFYNIINAVREGVVDCGLLIHEGQLAYDRIGLVKVLDLGDWWRLQTGGLPVPLGLNAVRADIEPLAGDLNRLLRESIEKARADPEAALGEALRYARWADKELVTRFVKMYVNELTIDMGDLGRRALREFYARTSAAGLLAEIPFKVV